MYPTSFSIENPFPVLLDDFAFRAAVSSKNEIRFQDHPNGTVVCSYMLSMQDTFNDHYAREARGIVFKNGVVVARPLNKFFNVNEKPDTQTDQINWSLVTRVMDKRDGSMIHTVNVGQDHTPFTEIPGVSFDVKSKKSYSSPVAIAARAFILKNRNYISFCQLLTDQNKTAVFEWTSPEARIVLAYPVDELKLLHIRDNITGKYDSLEELKLIAYKNKIPLVGEANIVFDGTQASLLKLVEETIGVEGWVIQFANGDMVKVKTKWYLERHRAMTFLRERDVVLMVLREELDDLKALLVTEGADLEEILNIEKRTVTAITSIETSVTEAYEMKKHLDRKEFAMYFQTSYAGHQHPFFGLLMAKYAGKETDYKGFYERKFLPEVSLRQINLIQSTAEIE